MNTVLRHVLIWGIYLLLLTPTIIATGMFFPFITGKAYFFRLLVEVLFGVWVVLALRDPIYRPKFSWIAGVLAAFLGVITLANIFGENFSHSFWSNYERMEGLITHIHLFAYFLIAISVLNTEKLWERFFHISLGVSLFIVFYGIIQLAGEMVINQGGVRVDGTFGNATYLAVYMLFHIFFTIFWYVRKVREKVFDAAPVILSGLIGTGIFILWAFLRLGAASAELGVYGKGLLVSSIFLFIAFWYLFVRNRHSLWVGEFMYGILLLLQLGILYNTATRGAILGLLGGFIVSALLVFFLQKGWGNARKAALAFLVGIIAMVGIFVAVKDMPFVRENDVLGRFSNITIHGAEARFFVWGMSLEGFKEKPIFGWGQENFTLVFNKYFDPRLYSEEPWFDRAHNVIFDWLVAGGIMGLLSYLSIFGAVLWYLWFYRREHSLFSIREKSILTGLLAAYFFQNIFVFDQLTSYLLFFSVLAFLHMHTVIVREKKEGTLLRDQRGASAYNNNAVQYAIISLVLLGTPFMMYALNANSFTANKILIKGIRPHEEGPLKNLELIKEALSKNSFGTAEVREQLVQLTLRLAPEQSVPIETKQQFFTLATEEMRAQAEKVPNNARSRLFLATVYSNYGQWDEALRELEEAVKVSPKKQIIYYMLANVYLSKGDLEKAFEAAQISYELETTNPEAWRYYLTTAVYAGHDDIAEELLKERPAPVDQAYINALVSRGKFSDVVALWERKIEKNPENLQSRISLAAGYLELGLREKSVEQIEKAIELDPDFKETGEYYIREIRAGRKPQ